jgi:hypothetical protein
VFCIVTPFNLKVSLTFRRSTSPPSSRLKSKSSLHVSCLDYPSTLKRETMFLRNVGLSPDYMTAQPRRPYCSECNDIIMMSLTDHVPSSSQQIDLPLCLHLQGSYLTWEAVCKGKEGYTDLCNINPFKHRMVKYRPIRIKRELRR